MFCKECGIKREGGIQDKIPLCHSCYLQIAESGKNPEEAVNA
jgi:ribosomal protein L37AE/L43A